MDRVISPELRRRSPPRPQATPGTPPRTFLRVHLESRCSLSSMCLASARARRLPLLGRPSPPSSASSLLSGHQPPRPRHRSLQPRTRSCPVADAATRAGRAASSSSFSRPRWLASSPAWAPPPSLCGQGRALPPVRTLPPLLAGAVVRPPPSPKAASVALHLVNRGIHNASARLIKFTIAQ